MITYINKFHFSSSFIPIPNRVTFKKYAHISAYKRKEPTLGINFLSTQSKKMLQDCLKDNTANPFFSLSDQYITQADPAFCGLTNLVMILNTLSIDPKRKWKGIWRWYSEENVKCNNIENVLDYGMTISEFSALLKCNGVNSKIYRPENDEYKVTKDINFSQLNKVLYDDITINKYTCINHEKGCLNKNNTKIDFNVISSEFMKVCSLASSKYENFYLMCNLGRKRLGQTGDGHFTPIAAYHKRTNMGLLLDSARFKYNSRWYDINDIYASLVKKDSFTKKPRGFLLIEKNKDKVKTSIELDEDKVSYLIKKEKYAKTLEEKAKVIDMLMRRNVSIINNTDSIWNTIKDKYKKEFLFRKYANFIYMFDARNFRKNLLLSLEYKI